MYKLTIALFSLMVVHSPLYASNEVDLSSSNENLEDMESLLAMSLEELMEVEIFTASKMKEKISKSVSTVTVIEQKQIKEMGARNLLDVLKIVPGFGVTQSRYGVRQIEVRGVRTDFSEKVLFMLNGHPLDSMLLTASSVWSYEDLPLGSVKRIEVVRGPGSALYGANAFLAVVNIITQNGKDLDGFHASVAGGSFDTQQYRASWGKQFDNSFEAALHFNFMDTSGISTPLYTDSSLTLLGESQLTERRYDLEWKLGYKNFKFEGRYIDKYQGTFFGNTDFLHDKRTNQNYENYFFKLSHKWNFTKSFTLDTQLYHDVAVSNTIWQVAPDVFLYSNYKSTRTGGEIQTNYIIDNTQTLIAGFSYAEESHGNLNDRLGESFSSSIPAPHTSAENKRSHWGIYIQDVWDPFKNLRLTLGVRYDEYSDFGGTLNPRVGFNWEFIENYSLKFSYGTAYRAPSVGELTLGGNPNLHGNPTLTPELVETLEGGVIAQPVKGLTTQVTYYYTDINKIIAPVGTSAPFVYENTGHIITQGVEAEIRYDFTDNLLNGSYLSANGVWQNSKQSDRQLANIPRYRINLMGNWAIDETWSSFVHVLIKSKTSRDLGDIRADVPSYAVVDLGLLGKNIFNNNFDVGFTVYNLFDKRYYDPAPKELDFTGDFQAAGISFFGHVDVHF